MNNKDIHLKSQKDWMYEYLNHNYSMQDLYNLGFRPRSNKYRLAVKEWKYKKHFYSITLELFREDYEEFKHCQLPIVREPDYKEICEYTYGSLQKVYELLNAFASGETQKQWARVEPTAVLGQVYGDLAPAFQKLKEALKDD